MKGISCDFMGNFVINICFFVGLAFEERQIISTVHSSAFLRENNLPRKQSHYKTETCVCKVYFLATRPSVFGGICAKLN